MQYLPPSQTPRLLVTDSLQLGAMDVGSALSGFSAALVNGDVNCVNVNATGNMTVGGTVTAQRVASSLAPISGSHLCTKTYTDALSYLTASTGLTKTGSILSVNAAQTQITSIGTLSSLTVSGVLTANTGSFSGAVAGATPTIASHLTRKDYVDGLGYLVAGAGLTKSSGTLSVNAAQTGVTSLGTLIALTVSGASVFSGSVTVPTPSATTDATNKAYVDSLVAITASGNLTKTAGVITLNRSISLTGITLSGGLAGTTGNFSGDIVSTSTTASTSPTTGSIKAAGGLGIGGSVYIGSGLNVTGDMNGSGNANITGFVACNRVAVGSLTPTSSSHLTSKQYVDSLVTTCSGNLTKTINDITLNPSISLTSITLTGAFSGATGTFSGNITAAAPTLAGHAATKSYVDGAVSTASGNLTKTGNNITLNALITLQTGIFNGDGGLSGPAVQASSCSITNGLDSGVFTCNDVSDATSTTTGSVKMKGGCSIVKNLFVAIAAVPTISPVAWVSNFAISGVTFTGLVDTSYYIKVGKSVYMAVIVSISSQTGGANAGTQFDVPFVAFENQRSKLISQAGLSLETTAGYSYRIHTYTTGSKANVYLYNESNGAVMSGNDGGNQSAKKYIIHFSYIAAS